MDFPKVGVNLPRPSELDAKTVETARKAGSELGEAVPKEEPATPAGGGDSFERVARAGQSAFAALVGSVAGGADVAGRAAERALDAVGELVEDPAGELAQTAEAFALGIGTTARRAADHVREAVLDRVEDTGLLDEGLGSEGVAHALGVVARRVGERAGAVADDAAEAAAPVADAVADATDAASDVIGAVADAAGDAAEAVGDAAGAAWDALTGGGS